MSTTCIRVPKVNLGSKCANDGADEDAYEDDVFADGSTADAGNDEGYQEEYADGHGDMPSGYNNPYLQHVRGMPNLVTRTFVVPVDATVGELRRGVIVKFDKEVMLELLQQKGYDGRSRRGNVSRMYVVNVTQGPYSKNVGGRVLMTLVGVCKPRKRTIKEGRLITVNSVLSTYAGEKDTFIAGRRKVSNLQVIQSQLGIDHEKLKAQYKPRSGPKEEKPTTAWVHENTELFGLASDHAEHYGFANDFGEDVTLGDDAAGHFILPIKLIENIISDTEAANATYKPDDLSTMQFKYELDGAKDLSDSHHVEITQELTIAALWADPSDYRQFRQ